MPRLLVIFHLYYLEQTDYFISKRRSIGGVQWDLIVSHSADIDAVKDRILEFKPSVCFVRTENVGYDVWPFLKVLKSVDLSSYDYVIKLHTKSYYSKNPYHFNGLRFSRFLWRDVMVDAFLGSPAKFRRALSILEGDRSAGMLFCKETQCDCRGRLVEESSLLDNEPVRIGMKEKYGPYCAGTIFFARADVLRIFAAADVNADMFAPTSSTHSGGTLAHTYERLFGVAVKDAGYVCRFLPGHFLTSAKVSMHKVASPVAKFIFSVQRWGDAQTPEITLLGFKIRPRHGK